MIISKFTIFSLVVILLVFLILMIDQRNNKEVPLSDRHPFLMQIISIIFALACLVLIIQFLKMIIEYCISLFNKVTSLDAVIIVAIIGGLVSIITLLISKIIDYKDKKRSYLSSKREKPYSQFVEVIFKAIDKSNDKEDYTSDEMIKDMNSFSKNLVLWGSPKVVSKYIEFRTNNLSNSTNLLESLENILNEMRRDLGTGKTKKGNLLSVFINETKPRL